MLRGETEVEVGSDREWKANSKLFGGSSRLSKGKGRRLLWTDSDASIPPAEERAGQCKLRSHPPTVDAMPLTQSQSLSPLPSATYNTFAEAVRSRRLYSAISLSSIASYHHILLRSPQRPRLRRPRPSSSHPCLYQRGRRAL